MIIIDDEPQSRQKLQELIARNHPEIEVIATANCVNKGCEAIKKFKPDLIFLDIEMPDGSGFDLLEQIDNRDFFVIFVTAHHQYAITAIKFEALDYLLKPFDEEELAEAVEKALKKQMEKITNENLNALRETLQNLELKKLPSRIRIPTAKETMYISVKDIIRLEADMSYTEITIVGTNKKLLASGHLKKYVEQFEPYSDFMKVHRSHMINLHFVESYVHGDGGYAVMKNKDKISVSKGFRDDFLDRLKDI